MSAFLILYVIEIHVHNSIQSFIFIDLYLSHWHIIASIVSLRLSDHVWFIPPEERIQNIPCPIC